MTEVIEFLKKGIPQLTESKDRLVFTNSGVTPAMVNDTLCEMGYTFEDSETNGWQNDCWLMYDNHDTLPPVTLFYSGYTFKIELFLTEFKEEE